MRTRNVFLSFSSSISGAYEQARDERMRYVAQLAEGMSTQLQVFQHHLHHFHSCILHQAEVEKSLRQRLHEVLIDAVDMCVPLCCVEVVCRWIHLNIKSMSRRDAQNVLIGYGSFGSMPVNRVLFVSPLLFRLILQAENEVVRAREDLERMNLYSPRSQVLIVSG